MCGCMCGFCNLCMCVCMGFVMYGCFDNCVGVLVTCVVVFIAFCTVCTVFVVLFRLCIFICFVCTSVSLLPPSDN